MQRMKQVVGLLLFSAVALGELETAEAQSANYLEQGWTSTDRQYFYRTTQGSRLISYRIFMNLEGSIPVGGGFQTVRFMSQQNLSRLGFLFDSNTAGNPDGLPIGFVKDTSVMGKPDAIGMTCSTCHTRDVVFKDAYSTPTRYRIDGAQSYVDMERFLSELQNALGWTSNDATQFNRLCAALGAYTSTARQQVRTELDDAYAKISEENAANSPVGYANNPGPGRLDAFAHIKNRVANAVYPKQYTFGLNNINATAPVSYPFLWDAPYLDHVQWPSNVANNDIGSLARNVGQVTGVFAETKTARILGVFTASSTANIPNLVELENKLLKLKSPVWPSGLAPLNQTLVATGDVLFNQYCANCHVEVDRAPRNTWIPVFAVGQSFVKTDETQAYNNLNDRAFAGQISADSGKLVNPLEILGYIGANILLPELWRAPFLDASHKQGGSPSAPVSILPTGENTLAAGEDPKHSYKSRPLNGIWATGPYLHNGSVRTLADLLLPGSQRPTSYCVGSVEIDTVGVGMKNDCAVPNVYYFNATGQGNLPTGHEYGTPADYRVQSGQLRALTAQDRAAIVEYMKTL